MVRLVEALYLFLSLLELSSRGSLSHPYETLDGLSLAQGHNLTATAVSPEGHLGILQLFVLDRQESVPVWNYPFQS